MQECLGGRRRPNADVGKIRTPIDNCIKIWCDTFVSNIHFDVNYCIEEHSLQNGKSFVITGSIGDFNLPRSILLSAYEMGNITGKISFLEFTLSGEAKDALFTHSSYLS